ncbi:MAG: hypothetical protein JXR62_03355 [Bacilli bacterium]|nr:hypothetical protein [Bacilli bacterium]
MKKLVRILIFMLLFIVMSGCSKEKTTLDWIVEDMAGIENPGFVITSKQETDNYISFVLEEIDMEMVSEFINDLTENPNFNYNINYVYDSNSGFYSYAAFNDLQESIHFTYNDNDRSGYFIYAKAGDAVFTPGVRDLGFMVRASFDYTSNTDYTEYIASMYYGTALNAKFTSSTEYLVSFILKDFEFTSESLVGNISFCDLLYGDMVENYQVTGTSIYDMKFGVCQKNVGTYGVSVEFGTENAFNAMGISQSDLDFTVSFTAEITSNMATYTHDYVITIMPAGNDVTTMSNYMDVYQYPKKFDEGLAFTKTE